jgi:hypothetical protein
MKAQSHRNRFLKSCVLLFAALAWCGFIIATSSTVILPHDFFAWMASRVFTEEATFRRFLVFWRYSWFVIVKGWHAVEFALLFLFIWALLNQLSRLKLKPRRNILLAAILCALFAISDEYHQTFVPGRGGTWTDVVIDCVGFGLAALLAWIFEARRARQAPWKTVRSANTATQFRRYAPEQNR